MKQTKILDKFFLIWVIFLLFQDFIFFVTGNNFILYIDELSLVVILIITIMVNKKLYYDKMLILAIFIFIYGLTIQFLFHTMDGISLLYLFYPLKFYLIYLYAQNLSLGKQKYIAFLKYFSYFFLFISIIGVINSLFGQKILSSIGYEIEMRNGIYRMHSILKHPSILGWFSAAFSAYFFMKYFILEKNKVNLILFVFSLTILVLTNSRKSLVATLILLLFFMFFASKRNYVSVKNISFVSVALIVGSVLILPQIITNISYTKTEYFGDETVPRYLLYQKGYEIAKDYFPIGSGVGTFGSIGSLRPYNDLYYQYGLSDVWGFTPENPAFALDAYWASIIAEYGLIGTFLFILMYLIIIKRILAQVKKSNGKEDFFLSSFALFLVLEGLMESIASPAYSVTLLLAVVFGTAGTLNQLKNENKNINVRNKS